MKSFDKITAVIKTPAKMPSDEKITPGAYFLNAIVQYMCCSPLKVEKTINTRMTPDEMVSSEII